MSDLVRAGLNFSIVLGAACYVEGILETILRELLRCRHAEYAELPTSGLVSINNYLNRIEKELDRDIGRTNGAAGYDAMFTLLTGHHLSELVIVKPIWEGITVLFNFRNVLGHGRQVLARQYSGYVVNGGLQEEFKSAYRVVEDYLRKTLLLNTRFVDANSELLYLTSEMADHFWQLARALPEAVTASLPNPERRLSQEAIDRTRAEAAKVSLGQSSTTT
jgi:hypothetical protein